MFKRGWKRWDAELRGSKLTFSKGGPYNIYIAFVTRLLSQLLSNVGDLVVLLIFVLLKIIKIVTESIVLHIPQGRKWR